MPLRPDVKGQRNRPPSLPKRLGHAVEQDGAKRGSFSLDRMIRSGTAKRRPCPSGRDGDSVPDARLGMPPDALTSTMQRLSTDRIATEVARKKLGNTRNDPCAKNLGALFPAPQRVAIQISRGESVQRQRWRFQDPGKE